MLAAPPPSPDPVLAALAFVALCLGFGLALRVLAELIVVLVVTAWLPP